MKQLGYYITRMFKIESGYVEKRNQTGEFIVRCSNCGGVCYVSKVYSSPEEAIEASKTELLEELDRAETTVASIKDLLRRIE